MHQKLGLLLVVLFLMLTPGMAQSDPCSLSAVLASFESAGLSSDVQTWLNLYQASDCSQNIKSAASAMARGYALAVEVTITGADDGITVESSVWTHSGIQVEAGQSITFRASGRVNLCEQNRDCSFQRPPAGEQAVCNGDDCVLSGARYGALLARIDTGTPFVVGREITVTALSSGELQFAVNDTVHGDNTGTFSVEVTIEG